MQEMCAVPEVGEQVRFSVSANPLVAVTLMVEVPGCPGALAIVVWPSMMKSAAGVDASHAACNLSASTEPKPVTWS